MALGEATTIGCFEPGDMPKNYRISNGFTTLIDDDLGLNGSKCYCFFLRFIEIAGVWMVSDKKHSYFITL